MPTTSAILAEARRVRRCTMSEAELQPLAVERSAGNEFRLERTRPDGRVIEVRRNPVPGGGFVLIYSDITERKRSRRQQIRAARDAAEAALARPARRRRPADPGREDGLAWAS